MNQRILMAASVAAVCCVLALIGATHASEPTPVGSVSETGLSIPWPIEPTIDPCPTLPKPWPKPWVDPAPKPWIDPALWPPCPRCGTCPCRLGKPWQCRCHELLRPCPCCNRLDLSVRDRDGKGCTEPDRPGRPTALATVIGPCIGRPIIPTPLLPKPVIPPTPQA